MSVITPARALPRLADAIPPRQAVLADRFPALGPFRNVLARDVFLMVAASLLLAACAQASFDVPFSNARDGNPVPITGQTFGVLLIGATLGSRRALGGLFLYLMWGWAGAPFFAGGGSGFTALYTGATAGYLWGFVVAAYAVGWFAERGCGRGQGLIWAMLLGNVLIYVVGLPVYDLWIGNSPFALDVWDTGLWPFIPGDMLKLLAAAAVVPLGWRAADRLRERRRARDETGP